ncbi:site-specific integrase [Dyadobacter sp. LHD-138]|uniref:site-specific integrase n=1 Tax=Dyadobacter sp. LHD-138 TaxID=3071413 RepID=UPI0027E073D8|nr:site-specific integrase [Dyadobacter sp. LHD-138]MDQ6482354.1 site-specific integrase [Dyadobacter sp. LHD-138]
MPLPKDKLKIHFRPKLNKSGSSYLYCRLRMGGVTATDFSTFIKVNGNWDANSQSFIESDLETMEFNQLLTVMRLDLEYKLREISKIKVPHVRDLRKEFINHTHRLTLIQLSQKSLNKIKSRIGEPGFSKGTFKAHSTLHMHIVNFMAYKKRNDIAINEITRDFGFEYIDYLRFNKKYTQNFIKKSIDRIKLLLSDAVNSGKIDKNPLVIIKERKVSPGEICFLRDWEMNLLKNNPLLSDNLQRVADAFLFQCYTGLSYSDLTKFSAKKHITEIRGRRVIQFHRTKNGIPFTIPILEYTDYLLKKYDNVIPVLSNQKMNQYIKVIAKTVGIDKDLTTHVGRKTAGTYLLNKDVPMIVVSKILGHDSIKTTEKFYAHLMPETILRHTSHLV